MRRLAALLVLTVALATPAGAQQQTPTLRGPAQPERPVFSIPEPIVLVAPPSFSSVPTASADAGRCRMACAQDYYFCSAQDEATECGPGWAACVLTCGQSATPAAPGV